MDDLVGLDDYDEDLVGEDDEYDDDDIVDDFLGIMGEEIGARRGGKRRRRRRTRRSRVSRGVSRVRTSPGRGRLLMFGGQAIAAGTGALDVTTTVQTQCRVDRLFISAVTGAGVLIPPETYTITDIKVGTASQFTANDPVPGILFTADNTAMMQGLGLDTLMPGTDFVVRVTDGLAAGNVFTIGAIATALR